MASKTSFKQQCPNCEAIVPIKDESLIGKRIRCPKCNEPFKVEDLEGVAATTKTAKPGKSANGAAAPKAKAGAKRVLVNDDEDQPKFKKKKGDSNKLVIGLGLAAVAVVLLVVTVIIVMNNNSGTTKTKTTSNNPSASRNTTPEPDKGTKPEDKAAPVTSFVSGSNITNMLPNETMAVINLPMKDIRTNTLGKMMFEDNLGASSKDAGRMGFTLEDVERWIIALSNSDPVWYFHIIRTTKPVDLAVLTKTLQLKPADGGPIQGQDYFITEVNWVETAQMLPPSMKPTNEPDAPSSDSHPMFVRLHDPVTLVIADQYPMKKFLEVKGHFKEEAPLPAEGAAGDSPFNNFPGGGGPRGGGGRGAPPGGRGAPPGATPPGDSQTPPAGGRPGAGGPVTLSAGNYRTINPHLKLMLDRVEANSPYLVSFAFNLENDPYVEFLAGLFLGFKGKFHTAGFSFQWKQDNRMVAVASVECDSDQAAGSLRQGIEQKVQPYYDKTFLFPPRYTFRVRRGREKPETDNRPGNANPGNRPGGPPRGPGGTPPIGPPGGPPPGGPGNPPGPGNPNQPNNQEPPVGVLLHVDLTTQGRWFNLATDIKARDEIRNDVLQAIEPYLVRMQGEFEMGMARPNTHVLAGAALSFVEQDSQFPRGTTQYRKPSPVRAGRSWPPDQRVSWMAELLPYLGYDQVSRRVRRDLSWRDDENITPASVLVPNFLAPGSVKSTWYVSYPAIEPELAATHFVGMAGVGLDAAMYPPDHPDAGIFNYDRRTSLAGVPNRSKTIFMIQVPPGFHSPWIAGGGSTIRGAPQTKSVEPFLSLNDKRERNTTVLMADGSVKTISGRISDDVFKALCRVKGDKGDLDLREMKPVPVPEDQPELKASPTAPPTAKAEEKKPVSPAPETKAAPPAPPAPPPTAQPPAAAPPQAGAPPGAK
jgi:hypothetical protein